MTTKRIAILGGGPIGMEAALYGAAAGFDVHLFERGSIASNVRRWGFVRVFTEWGRNRSPLALRLLSEQGNDLPPAESTSTGDELAEYVERLSVLAPLHGRVHPYTTVLAVTREGCLKSDFYEDPRRADFPFRLLLQSATGEHLRHADAVIDATGVYHSPNPTGNGGAFCPGERELHACIDYSLPDVLGSERARFANKHTMVIGSGHSAASTLLAVAELFEAYPETRLTWVVRRSVAQDGNPFALDPDDTSPHRQELHRRANELAHDNRVDFHPRTVVEALHRDGEGLHVTLRGPQGDTIVACDNIAPHTGFHADSELWRELQVPLHPATGGPLALSNVLMSENKRLGTGLSTGYAERQANPAEPPAEDKCEAAAKIDPRVADPALLLLPEPGFFVLGVKSYGRDAGFLMHNGFRQVRDAYKWISGDMSLDLYNGELG